ncbi:unnamed protein product [Rotaria magnacalcarata]|uniref:Uncharacterized protein n=1 Tax=Rotaria magnacalcarata TaxID=392030 RepID=A0A815GZU9_9BILA|nr:unnamed protein product [Rotaria magnacalcarata]
MIGISNTLPVEQEHEDIYDLSANGYVSPVNVEPAEEDLFHRTKRQANKFRYPPETTRHPQTFFGAVGGGTISNRDNWSGNIANSAGANGYRFLSPPDWNAGVGYTYKFRG